jgi:hypothetical protein
MELFATLVGAGVGVRVTVGGLESTFGVLERHVLILVVLLDSPLLALALPRRCAIVAQL